MPSKIVLDTFDKLKELHIAKDKDYAGEVPLSNFRRCEQFGIPAWKGCLVRMSDKWSRLLSLVAKDGEHAVDGEGIEDTLQDLAVYSVIVLALIQEDDTMPGEQKTPMVAPKYTGIEHKTLRRILNKASDEYIKGDDDD